MISEQNRADLHIHYYPEKIARHNETHPGSLDPETEDTIDKIIVGNIKYVGILGRISAASQETTDLIKDRLNLYGVEVVFGTEYLSLLPEDIRHLTSNGLVELVCLGFDHNSPEIKEKFGPDDTKFNSRVAKEYIDKLVKIGFDLTPTTDEQQIILTRLMQGKIPNKSDYLATFISKTTGQNHIPIKMLENKFGPISETDRRKNGFTPLKNWLYRLLFKLPSGLVASYYQTPTKETIDLVHQAGGVVLYSPEGKFIPEIMTHLLDHGIDGAMGWHGGRLDEVPLEWIQVLRRTGKLILGGSDYDPVKNHWQPGTGSGEMYISPRRGRETIHFLQGLT